MISHYLLCSFYLSLYQVETIVQELGADVNLPENDGKDIIIISVFCELCAKMDAVVT